MPSDREMTRLRVCDNCGAANPTGPCPKDKAGIHIFACGRTVEAAPRGHDSEREMWKELRGVTLSAAATGRPDRGPTAASVSAEAFEELALSQRDDMRQELWECYCATGANSEGRDARHLYAGEALRAVQELRADYDEAMGEGQGKSDA